MSKFSDKDLYYDDGIDLTYIPTSTAEHDTRNATNINEFREVVDSLTATEDRKKVLWKTIYENATNDRKKAHILFDDLYTKVAGDTDQHAIHGMTLTKYLERLEKANEQLIKLTKLISEAVDAEVEEIWDEETMYKVFEQSSEK